mmetsp:Transcript_29086/g.83589  ORF Transcript_29086/g.83589 Transcript_29086/m.83589 type:complete len:222 (-) Transcript_29086:738-1403(-)
MLLGLFYLLFTELLDLTSQFGNLILESFICLLSLAPRFLFNSQLLQLLSDIHCAILGACHGLLVTPSSPLQLLSLGGQLHNSLLGDRRGAPPCLARSPQPLQLLVPLVRGGGVALPAPRLRLPQLVQLLPGLFEPLLGSGSGARLHITGSLQRLKLARVLPGAVLSIGSELFFPPRFVRFALLQLFCSERQVPEPVLSSRAGSTVLLACCPQLLQLLRELL